MGLTLLQVWIRAPWVSFCWSTFAATLLFCSGVDDSNSARKEWREDGWLGSKGRRAQWKMEDYGVRQRSRLDSRIWSIHRTKPHSSTEVVHHIMKSYKGCWEGREWCKITIGFPLFSSPARYRTMWCSGLVLPLERGKNKQPCSAVVNTSLSLPHPTVLDSYPPVKMKFFKRKTRWM